MTFLKILTLFILPFCLYFKTVHTSENKGRDRYFKCANFSSIKREYPQIVFELQETKIVVGLILRKIL